MTIDDQTRRRTTKTGLTALDRDRACPGYTLYSPMNGPGDVYLLNLDGEEVHHWAMPDPPGLYGYLLPNGNLFYGGKLRDEMWDRFPSWKRFKGGVMMEVDWDGNVVWEHRDQDHHHDARRTEPGGAIYLTVELMSETLAAKVKGGNPITGEDGMWADVIVEVDASGKRIWEWHAAEHLDPERDTITFNDSRDEWSHGNTVAPLPDGRVMFSFRNISTVGIIDKVSGEIVWRLGGEVLAQQHDPSLLPNGNVLVYDNGSHSGQHPLPSPGWSRWKPAPTRSCGNTPITRPTTSSAPTYPGPAGCPTATLSSLKECLDGCFRSRLKATLSGSTSTPTTTKTPRTRW